MRVIDSTPPALAVPDEISVDVTSAAGAGGHLRGDGDRRGRSGSGWSFALRLGVRVRDWRYDRDLHCHRRGGEPGVGELRRPRSRCGGAARRVDRRGSRSRAEQAACGRAGGQVERGGERSRHACQVRARSRRLRGAGVQGAWQGQFEPDGRDRRSVAGRDDGRAGARRHGSDLAAPDRRAPHGRADRCDQRDEPHPGLCERPAGARPATWATRSPMAGSPTPVSRSTASPGRSRPTRARTGRLTVAQAAALSAAIAQIKADLGL